MNEQGTGNTEQGTVSRFAGPAVIALAAMVATAPLRLWSFSCGHDFDFHLVSWFDALHSWRQGIVYPHWSPSPNFGAGEPRFVFYPPLMWMLGAALGTVFEWRHVPFVLTLLLLAGVGMGVRALAREAMSDGPATLAGCFAIFSAYTMFTVYERSDYAELAGGFWIPLLLLLLLREARECGTGSADARRLLNGTVTPMAIVIAGAWLSNPTVGVMASYLLAALALVVAALDRSWMPLARAVISAALGLALSAFYWVPAAWEQRWVDIGQAVDDPGERIENSFLFARHASPLLEQHDIELLKVSAIVVFMVGVSLVALLIGWKRRTLPKRNWWIPLALIPVVVLLLQLPVSLPVWHGLPKLRYLQFPWRWLVALEAPLAVFLAAAVWPRGRRAQKIAVVLCALFFVASAGFAGIFFNQSCNPEDSVLGIWASYVHGDGFEGSDEYAPPGADNSELATSLPDACLVADPQRKLGEGDPDLTPDWSADQKSCEATYGFEGAPGKVNPEHLLLHRTIPQAGYLVLRLRRYPAWAVRVNGQPAAGAPLRIDGLMAVPVAAGPVQVDVRWTTTPDVTAGRWISVLALVAGVGLWALEHRRAHSQLK